MVDDYYDLGSYGRTVSTDSTEAQRWFDRGLVWTWQTPGRMFRSLPRVSVDWRQWTSTRTMVEIEAPEMKI